MTEKELLSDCLHRLNSTRIEYMLTGSMVSNYWGIPRTTHDLDFVISLSQSQFPELFRAFKVGFFLDESAMESASRPPYQFNAIDLRSPMKVDFWMLRPDPFEQVMFKRRCRISLFGVRAWISSAEDVILHKLYWNKLSPSDRQLGDAAGVLAVQDQALDRAYMIKWATHLGVTSNLKRLLTGKLTPKTT